LKKFFGVASSVFGRAFFSCKSMLTLFVLPSSTFLFSFF
jgi:hypothetical protein